MRVECDRLLCEVEGVKTAMMLGPKRYVDRQMLVLWLYLSDICDGRNKARAMDGGSGGGSDGGASGGGVCT